jgi:hypothetical protein
MGPSRTNLPPITDVRCILAEAGRASYTAVNSAMVAASRQIGRRIVEEEQGGPCEIRLRQSTLATAFSGKL